MKIFDSEKGMTLIEIMIAMAIMATLTIFISRTIRQGAQSKVKIEKDINRYSLVRDALKVMEADINRAFNYRDINIELWNEAMQEREKRLEEQANNQNNNNGEGNESGDNNDDNSSSNQSSEPREPFKPREYQILTHFMGEANGMHFTSLNNVRTVAGQKQSDQMEVGYFMQSCRGRINKKKQSNCLWRRRSPELDDEVDRGGTETVLLEDVTRFELRFLQPPTQEQPKAQWKADWDSTGAKEPQLANHFPAAVEITLEVQDKSGRKEGKKTAMTLVASIRNPNNPKPKTPNEENGAAPQTR